jgi:nucleotide-binding universal stress UspA family protein
MHHILAAIDGSDCATRALRFAAKQAGEMPATQLHVLAVQAPVYVYGEVDVYAGEARMRELAAQQTRAALDAAASVLRDAGISFSLEQVEGEPASTIARRSGELGCEWIVIGTRGRGRLETAIMGSVAQQVVHLATVPVTLVK